MDLVVEVPAIGSSVRDHGPANQAETSTLIRARVIDARARQRARFGPASQKLNRQLEGAELSDYCRLEARSLHLLEAAIQKFCLSARGCDRVLRVSRTIADLGGCAAIAMEHVAEALQYRFNEFSSNLRRP
jgi:magnesium chelatase family protein